MTKLSDTQLVVLSAACQRPDRNVLPLPANLKGGAQQKVVGSLLAKSFVEEGAAGPTDPVWRTDENGRRLALLATDAAFQALGDGRRGRGPRARTGGQWWQRAEVSAL